MTLSTFGSSADTPHQFIARATSGNELVLQRVNDGYINATAMCKATGKLFADYRRLAQTDAFLQAFQRSMGIPIDQLVQTITTGPNDQRGTWVHPQIAIHLALWASPEFAVQVSEWVFDWMRGERVIKPQATDNPFELIIQQAKASLELEKRQMALDQRQTSLEQRQDKTDDRVEALEAKIESVAGGPDCFTIKGYARLKKVRLTSTMARMLGVQATKMCKEQFITIGSVRDELHGLVHSYPEDILSIVFFNNNLLTEFN